MVIAYDDESVIQYMKEAVEYSQERPVLIDHFLEAATEIDVDALSDGEDVVIGGIMQHIEEAGIHSGDSSCVLPAVDIPEPVLDTIREYTFRLARALKVIGLMNMQFAIQRDKVLRHRGQSPRLAHRSLCLEGHGHPAGQDCRAPDDRPQAARVSAGECRARHRSRHRQLLLREVTRLSLGQVPGRGYGAWDRR